MSVSYVKALALILLMFVCSIEALSTNSSRHSQASFYGATQSYHTPSSHSLHVCLAFTATHGTLLTAAVSAHDTLLTPEASAHGRSLQLVLGNGTLTMLLLDSQQRVDQSIPLSIHQSNQSWLELELSVSGDNFTLQVQETEISSTLTYSLNFTGELHLAGDPSSNTTSGNFVGCLSNVAINSQAVEFSASTDEGGYNQGCCVPPRRLPPGGLGVGTNSLWGEILIEAREAVVDEGTNITISDMNLPITIPSDLVSYDIGHWYHSDLVNRVVFDVIGQPSSGYFVRGNDEHISRFYYHELQSSDPLSQIMYRLHCTGVLGATDSAVLRASLECQDGGESPWSQEVVLPFSIVEVNNKPRVRYQNTLSLAAGTRRPLTPHTITVVDQETTCPKNILYTVEQVECGGCVGTMGGQVVNHAGHKIMFFSQESINDGRIFFQHFALNDTDVTMRIVLRVQDSPIGNNRNTIYPKITVRTHPGQISFNPNLSECMFLDVGSTFILTSSYLNSTTDFQDQSPEIAYDVLVAPSNGRLEVYEANRWSLINESISSRKFLNTPSVIGYFTQKNIDDGHVRFVHTGEDGGIHTLKFRLRSSVYIQPSSNPNGYESVCFHTLDDFLLIQPEFVIDPRNVSVLEGDRTLINHNIISVALSEQEVLYAPVGLGVDIKIEQLQPIFVLESPPSVGEIQVRGVPIFSGENFTLADFQSDVVYYQNNGNELEESSDSFNIRIEPTVSVPLIKQPRPSDVITMTIIVSPDNDNIPTYSLHSINVTEGSYVVITRGHILVEDADLPREELTISFRRPRSNRPDETPTGYFAFRNKFDERITKCSMSNISNAEVVFVHQLDPSVPLSYNQALKITDGGSILRPWPIIEVHAIPHTLTVIEPDSAHCLSLDLTSNRSQILNISDYEFTMRDPHGMDSNLVNMVNVSVGESLLYGQVVNGNQDSASQFTINDLRMGRIQYQYTSEELYRLRVETVELYFQYGHTLEGPYPYKICINPILIPDHIQVQAATVSNDGLSVINSTHLWANDTRGDSGAAILYKITNPPAHGIIINEGIPSSISIDFFTQADVDDMHIAYSRPLKSGRLPDSFTFQVCSRGDVCSEEKELILNIRFVNLTIVNTGISVIEGDNYTFGINDFSVTPPPGYSIVRFRPGMHPKYGVLVLRSQFAPSDPDIMPTRFDMEDIRIGNLMYQSNTSYEVLFDSFTVGIVTYNSSDSTDVITITELISIRIIPVNDHVPSIIVNLPDELVVSKGGSIQITSVHLSADDKDSDVDNKDLIYSTIAFTPYYSYMYLKSDPSSLDTRISNWTEQDVRDGKLFLKAEFSEVPNDILILRVDETLELAKLDRGVANRVVVNIKIVDIIFTKVPGRVNFEVLEGETATIEARHLRYSANDYNVDSDEKILYEITAPPSHGQLFLNGTILLGYGGEFSQLQVVNRELSYSHDHSNSFNDSFQFKLSDHMGRERDKNFSFGITIEVIDDDSPEAVIFDPVLLVLRNEVLINENVIRITDSDTIPVKGKEVFDSDHDKIVCTVINATERGIIEYNRAQGGWTLTKKFSKFDLEKNTVRYRSTSGTLSGVLQDSFIFSISDGTNTANTTYKVNIYLLPEVVELTVSTLAIEEDQNGALESLHFIVEHFYLSQAPGAFIITSPPTKGYLMNTVTGETAISNFTTSQLKRESIVYFHYGGEDEFDEFTFFYRSDTMQGISRESDPHVFEIIITPNNDQIPILDTGRELTLQLWAGETKVLSEEYLKTTDNDTDSRGLRYTILKDTVDAYIAYSNDTAKAISTFTQQDVNEAKISFVHKQDPDGYIYYNVTDGEFVTSGNFSFESDPLMLFCDVKPWTTVSVSRLGSVVLSFDHVNCVTNDGELREIFYHILSELQYGEFFVNNERVMSFSKSEVENGVVSYRHTEEDRWEAIETVRLEIETDFDTTARKDLSINIDLPQVEEGRPAINTGATVIEGNTICLSLSSLDARNVRYQAWKNAGNGRPDLNDTNIRFSLMQTPSHGSLVVNNKSISESYFLHSDLASGNVCYSHDNSETLSDSFGFSLTVVGFQQQYNVEDTFSITIISVNDVPPVLATIQPRMELVVGFVHTLTTHILEITDEDSSAEDIEIVIRSLPKDGVIFQILLKDVVLNVGENFTQANVNAGHVTLKGLSMGTFLFSFYFTDNIVPPTQPTPHQFNVSVVPHTLNIMGTKRVILQQNEQKVKITKEFLYSDTNGDNGATVYSIVTHPTVGSVYNQTTPHSKDIHRTDRFTQKDIDNERVWYVPNPNSREHSDSFVVTLSNRDEYVPNETVSVHVLVWGDVKSDTFVDFTDIESEYSFQLPEDIFTLTQPDIRQPIRQIDPPKYGHLELRFRDSKRAAGNEKDAFSFHYDDLHRGWVFYVWDYDQPLSASEMEDNFMKDNFTLLVEATGFRPGEAFIELSIVPPFIATPPPMIDSTRVSVIPDVSTPTTTELEPESGFPVFTLVPIIGVVLLLLLIIVIIIGFCLTQQKRIRKKLHLDIATPTHRPNEVLSISPSPTRHAHQFNFEPDSEDERSLSSGFSEDAELPPLRSPIRSPTHSHAFSYSQPYSVPSPTYTAHRPLPLMAHRPRVLSNVSITLSGRQSAMSEISVNESNRSYSRSLPRPSPLNIAMPVPVRPASQVAYSAVNAESGYSTRTHTNDNSRHQSRSSVLYEEGEELTGGEFPSALEDHVITVKGHITNDRDHVTTVCVPDEDMEVDEGQGVNELLDLNLNDPNVQQLFRSTHPVLKKQEYWF